MRHRVVTNGIGAQPKLPEMTALSLFTRRECWQGNYGNVDVCARKHKSESNNLFLSSAGVLVPRGTLLQSVCRNLASWIKQM